MRTITKKFVWPDGSVAVVIGRFHSNLDEAVLELAGNQDRLIEFLGEKPTVGYGSSFETWWTQFDGRDGVRVLTEAEGTMTYFLE